MTTSGFDLLVSWDVYELLRNDVETFRRKLIDTNAACIRAGAEHAAAHGEGAPMHAWPALTEVSAERSKAP